MKLKILPKTAGYRTIFVEAHENKALGPLIVPYLRTLLFDLDRIAGVSDKVKRGLAVLRSFIGAIKLTMNDITIGVDIEPEKGTADSGDLEIDLPHLFMAIGEAAEDRNCAVAILIDEIQYFSQKELGALIMAMHKVQQKQLPLTLFGAGLPIIPGLAGESKSYAERLFSFPDIGALSKEDAFRALSVPAQEAGVIFEISALEEIYHFTKGYPYFLQEWGYQTWNVAEKSPITLQVVQDATIGVIQRLDRNFFRVRFDRLTPSEKQFLRAMAHLNSSLCRVKEIASILDRESGSLSMTGASLIKKGMIYSPAYGDIAFTVPLFDEFMIRAIPDLNFDYFCFVDPSFLFFLLLQ